jgi:hypothetical protein
MDVGVDAARQHVKSTRINHLFGLHAAQSWIE